jgi:hypothetical protein
MGMLMDCPTAMVGSVLPEAGFVITGAAACAQVSSKNNCIKKTAIPRKNQGKSLIFCGILIM